MDTYKFNTLLASTTVKARSIKEAWYKINRRFKSYKSGHVIGNLSIYVEIPSSYHGNNGIAHDWSPICCAITNEPLPELKE